MKASSCFLPWCPEGCLYFAKKCSVTNVKPVDKLLFICCQCDAKSIVSLRESWLGPSAVQISVDTQILLGKAIKGKNLFLLLFGSKLKFHEDRKINGDQTTLQKL